MIGFYNYTVILTYMGLSFGLIGIFISKENIFMAVLCLMLAGLCDTFDGKIARTKERTEQEKCFGIQIDSLTDLVCFGILPAMIGFQIGMNTKPHIAVLCFYVLAALIRLAYFNVLAEEPDDGTPKKFHGLPVTTAALIIPFCYSMHLFTIHTVAIFTMAILFTGIAFIIDFQIKKPGTKAILAMILFGAIELGVIVTVLYMTKHSDWNWLVK